MSTMEPDEGAQPDDQQSDAPRWDKSEAANPADAPRWDEVDTSGQADPDTGTDDS
jgi:hypothetical protein